jgi:hypothetical protein
MFDLVVEQNVKITLFCFPVADRIWTFAKLVGRKTVNVGADSDPSWPHPQSPAKMSEECSLGG